jgi:hypothetical protein
MLARLRAALNRPAIIFLASVAIIFLCGLVVAAIASLRNPGVELSAAELLSLIGRFFAIASVAGAIASIVVFVQSRKKG